MPDWTVRELARLAGVSVRTLHHYDAIGLLRPKGRSGAGYRRYGREELLRLRQILFFRSSTFPWPRSVASSTRRTSIRRRRCGRTGRRWRKGWDGCIASSKRWTSPSRNTKEETC